MNNEPKKTHQLTEVNEVGFCPITKNPIRQTIRNTYSDRNLWIQLKNLIKFFLHKEISHIPKLYFNSDLQFGFFYPRPSIEFIKKYYGAESAEKIEACDREYTHSSSLKNSADKILNYIEKYAYNSAHFKNNASEIGPGLGWLTKAAISRGYNWTAIDSNPSITEYLHEELGVNVINCLAKDLIGNYDLIATVDSVEHFLNPLEELQTIYNHINVGGIFFISVPNFNSITFTKNINLHRFFAYPAHLNYFTEKSLLHILKMVGFKNIKIESTNFEYEYAYILEPYLINKEFSWINAIFTDEMNKSGNGERLFGICTK